MGLERGATSSFQRDLDVERESRLNEEAEDAKACLRIVARYARTFRIAGRLLPAPKRRAAFAIYAACRTADDIVDTSGLPGTESLDALRRFRDEVFLALARRSPQPMLRELARA
jgi:phytoene/squalene synthetase